MGNGGDLFDTTQHLLTPEVFLELSRELGRSVDEVRQGMKIVLPTFLLGLFHKAVTQEGAENLLRLLRDEGFDRLSLNSYDLRDETSLEKGNHVLMNVFGRQLDSILSSLSSLSGLSPHALKRMMGSIVPLVLINLASHVRHYHLSTAGFMGYLAQQNLSFTSQGGIPSLSDDPTERKEKDNPRSWLLLGFLTFLFLGLLLWFEKGRPRESRQEMGTSSSSFSSDLPRRPSMARLEEFLINGTEADLPRRFVFENLEFLKGSSALKEEASEELNEIARVLGMHPHASVRIEGFSDKQDDWDRNISLSMARAEAVREQLISRGVTASDIEAIGRGQMKEGRNEDSIVLVVTGLHHPIK